MAGNLSLSAEVHVFPCPNCGETINTSADHCSFCNALVDHTAAEQAAVALRLVNQACSDASYLKIMGAMFGTFFLLRFVPLLGIVGIVGFWFLEFAIPVMVIRWWIKFGAINTADAEFHSAKRTALLVGLAATLFWTLILTRILHV